MARELIRQGFDAANTIGDIPLASYSLHKFVRDILSSSHAACCHAALPVQYRQHLEALTGYHKQLTQWAENCPENFENRAALVGAEIARIEGHVLEAEQLYEIAIRSAHSNGFVHNEAIAYEFAARFYAARGFEKFADQYLLEARDCYQRWRADGKV